MKGIYSSMLPEHLRAFVYKARMCAVKNRSDTLTKELQHLYGAGPDKWRQSQEAHIKSILKIRIEVLPTGGYRVMNVTGEMPEEFMQELPAGLLNKLSLMLLVDKDSEVEGLGYRYSDNVFYIDGEDYG